MANDNFLVELDPQYEGAIVDYYTNYWRKLTSIATLCVEFLTAARGHAAPEHAEEIQPELTNPPKRPSNSRNTTSTNTRISGRAAHGRSSSPNTNKRSGVKWFYYTYNDFLYAKDLVGGTHHAAVENMGMGNCGYAAFIGGVGENGTGPTPDVVRYPKPLGKQLVQTVRDAAANWLRGVSPNGGASNDPDGDYQTQRIKQNKLELATNTGRV